MYPFYLKCPNQKVTYILKSFVCAHLAKVKLVLERRTFTHHVFFAFLMRNYVYSIKKTKQNRNNNNCAYEKAMENALRLSMNSALKNPVAGAESKT